MQKYLWVCGIFFITSFYRPEIFSQEVPFPPMSYQIHNGMFLLSIDRQQFVVPQFDVFQVYDLRWHKHSRRLYIFYQFIPEFHDKITVNHFQAEEYIDFLAIQKKSVYAQKPQFAMEKFYLQSPSATLVKAMVEEPYFPIPGSIEKGDVVFVPYIPFLDSLLEQDFWIDAVSKPDTSVRIGVRAQNLDTDEEDDNDQETNDTEKSVLYRPYENKKPQKAEDRYVPQRPPPPPPVEKIEEKSPRKIPIIPYPAEDSPYIVDRPQEDNPYIINKPKKGKESFPSLPPKKNPPTLNNKNIF